VPLLATISSCLVLIHVDRLMLTEKRKPVEGARCLIQSVGYSQAARLSLAPSSIPASISASRMRLISA
jgi:hypothetical protein